MDNTPLSIPDVSDREALRREVVRAMNWDGGNVRGVSLKTDSFKAVDMLVQANAHDKIEELFAEFGFEVSYDSLSSYAWYPAGTAPAIYLIAAHLFSWSENDVAELGRTATHGSFFIKLIMRFVSMKSTLSRAPGFWRKYYDFGKLEPIEYNENGKFIIFRIHGYDIHPINEFYHKGYFRGIVELVTGSDSVQVEMGASVYQGDPYSEYSIFW